MLVRGQFVLEHHVLSSTKKILNFIPVAELRVSVFSICPRKIIYYISELQDFQHS